MERSLNYERPDGRQRQWTAFIALAAAVASLSPIFLPFSLSYFSFGRALASGLGGWFFLMLMTTTPYFAIVSIGLAAMAINGELTIFRGMAIGIAYLFSFFALAAAMALTFFWTFGSGRPMLLITASLATGGLTLAGIFRFRGK